MMFGSNLPAARAGSRRRNLLVVVATSLVFASLWLAGCSSIELIPESEAIPPETSEEPTVVPGTVLTETEYGKIIAMEGGIQVEIKQTPAIGERSEADRQASIESIRRLAHQPDLAVEYVGPGRHSENSLMAVEAYRSPGTEYLVAVDNNQVVYYQVTGGFPPAGQPLNYEELERLARQLLTSNNACFTQVEGQLEYRPGGKGENSFFRWQRPTPNADNPWDQPTFVQVGIRQDGYFFSYIDSGICGLLAPATP